jgi:hypothetical protein
VLNGLGFGEVNLEESISMTQKEENKLRQALAKAGITDEKKKDKVVAFVDQTILESTNNALRAISGNNY